MIIKLFEFDLSDVENTLVTPQEYRDALLELDPIYARLSEKYNLSFDDYNVFSNPHRSYHNNKLYPCYMLTMFGYYWPGTEILKKPEFTNRFSTIFLNQEGYKFIESMLDAKYAALFKLLQQKKFEVERSPAPMFEPPLANIIVNSYHTYPATTMGIPQSNYIITDGKNTYLDNGKHPFTRVLI